MKTSTTIVTTLILALVALATLSQSASAAMAPRDGSAISALNQIPTCDGLNCEHDHGNEDEASGETEIQLAQHCHVHTYTYVTVRRIVRYDNCGRAIYQTHVERRYTCGC